MRDTGPTVSINGVEYPRGAVEYGHVAPLLRLATHNVVRSAEIADISRIEDPRELLARTIASFRQLSLEQINRLRDILDNCYGPPGHDFAPGSINPCRRCGAVRQA
jgi:hypothetical protein